MSLRMVSSNNCLRTCLDALSSAHRCMVQVCMTGHILQLWLPVLQIILSIVEDLASLVGVLPWCADVTWDNGGIV